MRSWATAMQRAVQQHLLQALPQPARLLTTSLRPISTGGALPTQPRRAARRTLVAPIRRMFRSQSPALSATKQCTDAVGEGGLITFSGTITNTGNVTL